MVDRGLTSSYGADVWEAEAPAYRRHDSLPRGGIEWGGCSVPEQDPSSVHACAFDPDRAQRLDRLSASKKAAPQGCTACGKLELRAAGYCHACYVRVSRKLTCTRCGAKRAGPATGLCFSCYAREASQ